jgi:hypothetical protein
MVRRLVPGYRDIHPMASDEPEECNLLLARSFAALDLAAIYDVPSYADYRLATNLRRRTPKLRAQVQLIQGSETPRSWVLRTPAPLFATDAVLDAFQDAFVVQRQRDPLVCLTSYCSLAANLRQANSEELDPLAIGPRWQELWTQGVERSEEPPGRCRPDRSAPPVRTGVVRAGPRRARRAVYCLHRALRARLVLADEIAADRRPPGRHVRRLRHDRSASA